MINYSSNDINRGNKIACAFEISDNADKKTQFSIVTEALLNKEAKRIANLKAQKIVMSESRDPNQDVDKFVERFKATTQQIETNITTISKVISQEKIVKVLHEISESCKQLRNDVASATIYLPSYLVRQCFERMDKLNADIETVRTSCIPRKKFSFRKPIDKKLNIVPTEKKLETKHDLVHVSPQSRPSVLCDKKFDFSNRENERIEIDSIPGDCELQDVFFSDLTGCSIRLLNQTGSMKFRRIHNCHVYIGPVKGSSSFDNCFNCRFYIAARQIRIHNSTECDFYLHVLSNPIIERCSSLRFAPYALRYPLLQKQLKEADLELRPENDKFWCSVNDFCWLKKQQSPNWCTMGENQRELVSL